MTSSIRSGLGAETRQNRASRFTDPASTRLGRMIGHNRKVMGADPRYDLGRGSRKRGFRKLQPHFTQLRLLQSRLLAQAPSPPLPIKMKFLHCWIVVLQRNCSNNAGQVHRYFENISGMPNSGL
jgi:hypothetical protein